MAPGKISKLQKPTGSVEVSSSQNPRKQEMKPMRQSARLLKRATPQDLNAQGDEDGHGGEVESST